MTDPAGRHLSFTYGLANFPYQVTQVTSDPGSGIKLTYTYGTWYWLTGATPILTQVTQADNTVVTFTYDSNSLITSVNDTNGKVLESHTYADACNAGLSSSRANGVDALTISYFPNFQYYCGFSGIGVP